MDRNLSLDIVRIAEAAGIACAEWVGRGDKEMADKAAVDAMRSTFDSVDIEGTVVIGEGEMDEAPMLYIGERVGTGRGPKVDIAVDPLEGTNLCAKAMPNAIAVLAMAPAGCLLHAPDMYMDKIAVGPRAAGKVHLDWSVTDNIRAVAAANGKPVDEVTVIVLGRPRHEKIIAEARAVGARVKLISDGDVSAALLTAIPETGVDIMFGIGGAPEGVLAAAALKAVGGDFQGRLMPETDAERARCAEMGLRDLRQILYLDDLVKGDEVLFAATGVTGGDLLKGVRATSTGVYTHSVVMSGPDGTVRFIETFHRLAGSRAVAAAR